MKGISDHQVKHHWSYVNKEKARQMRETLSCCLQINSFLLLLFVCFWFFQKQGIYKLGEEPGVFSMRIVGIKRASP